MRQEHYWIVETEGFDWTSKRKIWNKGSAKAAYNLEKPYAGSRKINIFKVDIDGIKRKII